MSLLKFIEPSSEAWLIAAEIIGKSTRWFFDLLRNVMILGILRYLSDASGSTAVYALFLVAAVVLIMYLFSLVQQWRLRPFYFLGDGFWARLLDTVAGGALAGLLLLLVGTPVMIAIDEIGAAQGLE